MSCLRTAGSFPTICHKRAADFAKALARRHVGCECNGRELRRHALRAIAKEVAALRFAGQSKLRRQRTRNEPRDVEQVRLIAAFELELDFAKPHRLRTGFDRAHIEREFDDRAAALDQKDGPAHARFELRLELAAKFAGQEAVERGAARLLQVRLSAGNFAFPLVADEDIGIVRRLDGLDIASADAAHTQRHAVPPQFVLVGVEIDGDLRGALGGCAELPDQGQFTQFP